MEVAFPEPITKELLAVLAILPQAVGGLPLLQADVASPLLLVDPRVPAFTVFLHLV